VASDRGCHWRRVSRPESPSCGARGARLVDHRPRKLRGALAGAGLIDHALRPPFYYFYSIAIRVAHVNQRRRRIPLGIGAVV
jgi:hypothetical protein